MSKTLGKPEPHSDVLNKEPRTLLIGYGWVGQYVHKYFTQADVYTPSRGMRNAQDEPVWDWQDHMTGRRWDVAFISTPSPMKEDGSCDTSMVEASVEKFWTRVKLFIIRSTVAPGTLEKLQEKYRTNLFVMQPEYLGETLGHPLFAVDYQTFIILGGKKEATERAAYCWSKVLHPGAKIRQIDGKAAEFCKYMENSFLATKVIFVNDWARLARKAGVDFYELREAWLDDPRIGRSHTFAYEENPGFSGKCLPKDLNAIAYYARHIAGQPLELIEAVLEINAEMRKNSKNSVPLLPEDGLKKTKAK